MQFDQATLSIAVSLHVPLIVMYLFICASANRKATDFFILERNSKNILIKLLNERLSIFPFIWEEMKEQHEKGEN